ncbi:MAG TPA: M56 family metallopeptidase [Verrucomicrobiae bacterium]|nr:M56 family metallopeptidase [Verrucomicrobiae bacterium]
MSEAFIPVISLLVKSTVVVFCAGALVAVLRALNVAAAVRHFVWLSAFIAIAFLPTLASALPQITVALPYSALGIATPDLSTPGEHLADHSVAAWIWSVYAIGVSAMLARLVGARAALSALWRRAQPHAARGDLDDIQRIAGVRDTVELRICNKPIAPLTWGARVLLPATAINWPAPCQRDVLLHELCHMARRDSLTQMLAAIVRAAFWFSPAVWFAMRELRIEQERVCDERVLAGGVAAADYAQTLVDVAADSQPFQSGMGVSTAMVQPSHLERRVVAILEPQRARPLQPSYTAMLGAALLCTGAALAATQPQDSARILGSLAPLTAIQQPLATDDQRLAPLSPPTARANAPEAQGANSKR